MISIHPTRPSVRPTKEKEKHKETEETEERKRKKEKGINISIEFHKVLISALMKHCTLQLRGDYKWRGGGGLDESHEGGDETGDGHGCEGDGCGWGEAVV